MEKASWKCWLVTRHSICLVTEEILKQSITKYVCFSSVSPHSKKWSIPTNFCRAAAAICSLKSVYGKRRIQALVTRRLSVKIKSLIVPSIISGSVSSASSNELYFWIFTSCYRKGYWYGISETGKNLQISHLRNFIRHKTWWVWVAKDIQCWKTSYKKSGNNVSIILREIGKFLQIIICWIFKLCLQVSEILKLFLNK